MKYLKSLNTYQRVSLSGKIMMSGLALSIPAFAMGEYAIGFVIFGVGATLGHGIFLLVGYW